MSPLEHLQASIRELAELAQRAEQGQPIPQDQAEVIMRDLRGYLAACVTVPCPARLQPGVSSGSFEDALRIYRPNGQG